MQSFRTYMEVGGMPQAVSAFVEGRTYEEIDFLLIKKKKVCPIEVKSSGCKTHKSFDFFIQKYPIKVEDLYIIYSKDFKYEDGITYIPFYMAMCL